MKNVIKASFYHLLRTKYFLYTILSIIAIESAMGFTAYMQGEDAKVAVRGSMDNWIFFSFLIAMLMLAAIIGSDFKNKTIYYEVMSGHLRREIYLGRMIPYLLCYWLVLTIGLIGAYSIGCLRGGWLLVIGGPGQMLLDYLMLMINSLPFFTMCVFSMYAAGNLMSGLGLEWALWLINMLTMNINGYDLHAIWLQGLKKVATLWMMHPIIAGDLSGGEVAGMIVIDAIKCVCWILIGIKAFERRDLL